MVKCECGGTTKVTQTYGDKRRRRCDSCGLNFTTKEIFFAKEMQIRQTQVRGKKEKTLVEKMKEEKKVHEIVVQKKVSARRKMEDLMDEKKYKDQLI
jgi:transcriptional regulator NrdR family protein